MEAETIGHQHPIGNKKKIGTQRHGRRFTCSECKKQFARVSHLETHMRIHSGEKPYACSQCNRGFSCYSNMKRHTETHRYQNMSLDKERMEEPIKRNSMKSNSTIADSSNIASFEGNSVDDEETLMNPCSVVKPLSWSCQSDEPNVEIKSHNCDSCELFFTSCCELSTHNAIHTEESPFNCEKCGKRLPEYNELATIGYIYSVGEQNSRYEQIDNFKKENDTSTENVDAIFSLASDDRIPINHIKIEEDHKRFSCVMCQKKFARRGNLNDHLKTHTGEKPYTCDTCNKKFTCSSNLNKHRRIHTGEKPYSCSQCNKSFTENRSLKKHRMIHVREMLYNYDLTDVQESSQFIDPSRASSTEKRYTCDLCWRKFSTCKKLYRHRESCLKSQFVRNFDSGGYNLNSTREMNSLDQSVMTDFENSGNLLYKCCHCDKQFRLLCRYKIHMRIHSGEKPFECNVCNKTFAWSSNLKKHRKIHTGEKPYECSECGKHFTEKCSLIRHGEKKHNLQLACEFCDQSFPDQGKLANHFMQCHMENTLGSLLNDSIEIPAADKVSNCDEPSQWFVDSDRSVDKMAPHSKELLANDNAVSARSSRNQSNADDSFNWCRYVCFVCKKRFARSSYLNCHMKVHTGEKPFSCSVCDKRFSCSSNLTKHKRTHTGEKPYACDHCNRSFSENRTLIKHKRTHIEENPYVCSECGERFVDCDSLKDHLLLHELGEENFTCDRCWEQFKTLDKLCEHSLQCGDQPPQFNPDDQNSDSAFVLTVKQEPSETFPFPFACKTEAPDVMDLVISDVFNYEEKPLKPHICVHCEKSFKSTSHLNAHKKIHSGEKPFACTVCEKTFAWSGNLTKHKRTHTGEKLYSCNFCDKRFTESRSMVKHQQRHIEESVSNEMNSYLGFQNQLLDVNDGSTAQDEKKRYVCSVCEKRFARKTNLNSHMKIHTGEKPYMCFQCDKRFSCSSNWRKHVRTHSGEKPYRCDQCDKSYTESGSLTKHKRQHSFEMPYSCALCDLNFKDCTSLKFHLDCHATDEKTLF